MLCERPANVTFDPAWRTPAVLGLARTVQETGDFSLYGILADALEEADCTDVDLLNPLRGLERYEPDGPGVAPGSNALRWRRPRVPVPHARGCHVLDLVLGKE